MTLRSGFTWLLTGNVLYSACQLGIAAVLARLGSIEQVGQYALGMAVAAPILMLGDFQLRALIASDLKEKFSFGQYLTFRFVFIGLALLVVAATALLTRNDGETARVIVIVGIAQTIEFISDTYYGLMQRNERLDRMSRSLLVKGPLGLGLLAAGIVITHSVFYAVLGLAVARLLVLLTWDMRLSFMGRAVPVEWGCPWPRLMALLQLAVPLGLVSMLASVNSNIPRYFLEAYKGHTALGIFSPIASLLTAGALIVSSMGQAAFVPVAQAYEAADIDRYRRFVVRALALACGLGIVGIVASAVVGREILALLFGTAYGDQSRLLVWLACAGAISFAVSGLGYIMTAARFLNPQVPLLAASCVAAVGGSIWLIPRYGLDGAAWVVGLSALVQLAGTFLILFRIDRKLRMEQRLRDEVALNIDHEVQLSLARSAEGGVR